MSDITIVRDYPHPVERAWQAVTDPDLVPYRTATGRGARPVGFAPTRGTHFQLVAAPLPGWSGVVECEVLESRPPALLRFSWVDGGGGETTLVSYRLEPHSTGTRFTYRHTGFTGIGGFAMSRILGSVRRRMLTDGLPAVLADMDEHGRLRADSVLRTGRPS
ncbi:SRPBCC domain-containing protein [Pseudonocardia sp. WMMC193]|uniref:SRPBCC family protein n=1 Tax=Pseudonocardia sp. WMMC193 TaxID=2911965 RepID=UPI001F2193CA|nr:SRPBCC domain-containing protein [Pseudonocardia sp. WMMC193]MCF7548648.1 SRPBCC domain-containing protein [Pseudonocardia sp. WMMC193]